MFHPKMCRNLGSVHRLGTFSPSAPFIAPNSKRQLALLRDMCFCLSGFEIFESLTNLGNIFGSTNSYSFNRVVRWSVVTQKFSPIVDYDLWTNICRGIWPNAFTSSTKSPPFQMRNLWKHAKNISIKTLIGWYMFDSYALNQDLSEKTHFESHPQLPPICVRCR